MCVFFFVLPFMYRTTFLKHRTFSECISNVAGQAIFRILFCSFLNDRRKYVRKIIDSLRPNRPYCFIRFSHFIVTRLKTIVKHWHFYIIISDFSTGTNFFKILRRWFNMNCTRWWKSKKSPRVFEQFQNTIKRTSLGIVFRDQRFIALRTDVN